MATAKKKPAKRAVRISVEGRPDQKTARQVSAMEDANRVYAAGVDRFESGVQSLREAINAFTNVKRAESHQTRERIREVEYRFNDVVARLTKLERTVNGVDDSLKQIGAPKELGVLGRLRVLEGAATPRSKRWPCSALSA